MEISRHWRLKAQRYRLAGSTCPSCGRPIFPPRPVCPHCHSQLAPIAKEGLTMWAASIGLADFEAHIRRPVAEGMPR